MRYKAIVSYDGTNYDGWQSQPSLNTIQDQLEIVLTKMNGYPTSVTGAGRTDAGVHAKCMVFHFDSHRDLPQYKWIMGMNSYLPLDIRIQEVIQVSDNFHARFSSKIKTYQYTIDLVGNNPFTRLYAYSCYYKLDIEAMKKASEVFLGTHDFTSFNASPIEYNQVKTVDSIKFKQEDNLLKIIFKGPGFLRFQVRMMVGCLIEIGKGKMTIEQLQEVMKQKQKGACRYKASANGLCLMDIEYKEDNS